MPVCSKDIEEIEHAGWDRRRFLRLGKYLRTPGGRCFFLRRDSEGYCCEIYEHRPSCCKTYPFHPLKDDVIATWTSKCPALQKLRER